MALAAGVVLAVTGGYLTFRSGTPVAGGQQVQRTTATPRSAPAPEPSAPTASRSTGVPVKQSSKTAKPKTTSTQRPAAGGPVRIAVPRLGVSARVLGIRARGGQLIPPADPKLVGWWSEGARPGAAKGSAIITGHTVHTGGGAFDDLDLLRAGDTVKVTNTKGTLSYSVVAVATYRKKTLAKQAAQLFDQSIPGRLVLVTCEDWDGTGYLSNAVVIAKPVD